jgi:hypothetical protein
VDSVQADVGHPLKREVETHGRSDAVAHYSSQLLTLYNPNSHPINIYAYRVALMQWPDSVETSLTPRCVSSCMCINTMLMNGFKMVEVIHRAVNFPISLKGGIVFPCNASHSGSTL